MQNHPVEDTLMKQLTPRAIVAFAPTLVKVLPSGNVELRRGGDVGPSYRTCVYTCVDTSKVVTFCTERNIPVKSYLIVVSPTKADGTDCGLSCAGCALYERCNPDGLAGEMRHEEDVHQRDAASFK
jgi:hypothetical protein